MATPVMPTEATMSSKSSNSEDDEVLDQTNDQNRLIYTPGQDTSQKRRADAELQNQSKKYQCNFLTPNRFAPLSNIDDQPTTSQDNQIEPKIPPIFLYEVNDYQEIIKDIKTIAKNNFTTRQNGPNTIKINTTTINDFRSLTMFYDSQKVKFFTFKPPDNKLFSVVIKNVPLSLTENEIKTELEQTYNIYKVVRLQNKFKDPIPVCAVDLKKDEKSSRILNLNNLFHAIVTVEPRRKKKTYHNALIAKPMVTQKISAG